MFHTEAEALQNVTKYGKSGIIAKLTLVLVTAGLLFGLEQENTGAKSFKPGLLSPEQHFWPP